jgi:glycosyltransferase involved in cell wall biosynthesis
MKSKFRLFFRIGFVVFVSLLSIGIFAGGRRLAKKVHDKQWLGHLNWARLIEPREEKSFVITIPSYRNAKYYEQNLHSVFSQNYENYRVIYVDDASPDETYEKVKNYVTEKGQWHRFTLLKNEINRGSMFNHVLMSQYYRDDEIVVALDGDDFLASDQVLKDLNRVYANPQVWATYGQHISYPDYTVSRCLPKKFSTLKKGAVRELPWFTSALRTFYGGLFHRINVRDFLYEGSFLPMASDLAYICPIVEMAREHVYCTAGIWYIYNLGTGINDSKKSRSKQVFFEEYIRNQPRYEKLGEHPGIPYQSNAKDIIDAVLNSIDM